MYKFKGEPTINKTVVMALHELYDVADTINRGSTGHSIGLLFTTVSVVNNYIDKDDALKDVAPDELPASYSIQETFHAISLDIIDSFGNKEFDAKIYPATAQNISVITGFLRNTFHAQ